MAFENALTDCPDKTFFDPNLPIGKNKERYERYQRTLAIHDSTGGMLGQYLRQICALPVDCPTASQPPTAVLPDSKEQFVDFVEARKHHAMDYLDGIEAPQFAMKSHHNQVLNKNEENAAVELERAYV